jgi:hypothetical protein
MTRSQPARSRVRTARSTNDTPPIRTRAFDRPFVRLDSRRDRPAARTTPARGRAPFGTA